MLEGETLGKFRILSTIGRGGYGVVYLAEDTTLGRRVAIKVLMNAASLGTDSLTRFHEEARTVARLTHPNIVQVYSFDVVENVPVIEMEYIEGGSLAGLRSREFLSPTRIVCIIRGISDALAYCHSAGSAHRDIKPSNILIDQWGAGKLADFGIARTISVLEGDSFSETLSTTFRGTPLYSPPEAWEGAQPTARWDIYSLGAVLYECLAGMPPYVARSHLELVKLISSESAPSLGDSSAKVSDELTQLVDRMLERQSENRPGCAEEVIHALERTPEFQAEENHDARTQEIRAVAGPPRVRFNRFFGWGSRWPTAFLIVASVLVISFIYFYYDSKPARTSVDAGEGNIFTEDLAQGALKEDSDRAPAGSRTPGDVVVNAISLDGAKSRLLLSWGEDESFKQAVYFDGYRLGLLTADESGAQPGSVRGDWAGFEDVAGTVFTPGTVTGVLVNHRESISGLLRFASMQDGSVREISLAESRNGRESDVDSFVRALEGADFVQAMLYQELIPRGASWADTIEQMFPSGGRSRLPARRLSETAVDSWLASPTGERMNISSEYMPANQEAFAFAGGTPDSSGTLLNVAFSNRYLVFSASCEIESRAEPIRLELLVGSRPTVPIRTSKYSRIQILVKTQSVSVWHVGDFTSEVDVESFASSRYEDGRWSMNVLVPIAAILPVTGESPGGQRVRLQALLEGERDSGERATLARWGGHGGLPVYQGELIQFVD